MSKSFEADGARVKDQPPGSFLGFPEVYKDQSMAGIWLEAGAALAMTITATLFLPRYMALGLTTTSEFLGGEEGEWSKRGKEEAKGIKTLVFSFSVVFVFVMGFWWVFSGFWSLTRSFWEAERPSLQLLHA